MLILFINEKVLGVPGKVIRIDENQEVINKVNAEVYVDLASRHALGEFPLITSKSKLWNEKETILDDEWL